MAPFGFLLAPFGSLLAPFGSLLPPFGSLWVHVGRFWHPFRSAGSLFAPFGLHFGPFWLPFLHLDRFLVPLFRRAPADCRQHLRGRQIYTCTQPCLDTQREFAAGNLDPLRVRSLTATERLRAGCSFAGCLSLRCTPLCTTPFLLVRLSAGYLR